MTPGVYVAGCEPATGKSAVALGVQQLLARRVERLGVFRPVVADAEHDPLIDLLRPTADFVPYAASCGVGYEEVRADEARALEEIVARYRALAAQCDGVLVVGTDFAGVGTAGELAFNARVALNLGLPALLVVSGHDRTPDEVRDAIVGRADDRGGAGGRTSSAWSPTGCARPTLDAVAADGDVPVYALPEVDLLMAPTVGQVAAACHGEVIAGDDELLGREALHLIVAAMTLPNLMERIVDGAVLITPGDRAEVLLAAMFAHASTELPSPAGVVLTGGLRPPEKILGPLGSFGGVAAGRPDRARHVRDGRRWPSAREGAITPRRAAQDQQGAGAVRDARGRRRAAGPDRRRPLGGGDAADVRVHAARPRAGAAEAHRAARGDRRARAAGGRHPAAPARRRADAARRRGRGPRRGRAARAGPVRARTCSTRPTRSWSSASRRSTRRGARTRA